VFIRHTPQASRPSPEVRIAKLDELRGKGLVTDEEYQQQRAHILQDL